MDVVSYKCPKCSAPLSFQAETQNWSCQYCSSSYSVAELEAGNREAAAPTQQAIPTGATTQTWDAAFQDASHTYGADAKAYSCPTCGGTMVTDAGSSVSFCTYCHNPAVIASELSDQRRPSMVIPFKLEKNAAVSTFQKLCKNKLLLPKVFRDILKKGEITGLYVPYWLYSCDVEAQMQGQGQNVSTWTDKKFRYTKTDTYRVERGAAMRFQNVPADGSTRMDDELMHSLEPFSYKDMVEFSMSYLTGHVAEGYDVDSKQAGKVAQERIRSGVESKMRGLAQSYTNFQLQDLKANSRNNACQYVLLPVWTMMADYKGKKYVYAMNGQTGKVTGNLPTSWARLGALSGGVFAIAFAIFMLGGMFL